MPSVRFSVQNSSHCILPALHVRDCLPAYAFANGNARRIHRFIHPLLCESVCFTAHLFLHTFTPAVHDPCLVAVFVNLLVSRLDIRLLISTFYKVRMLPLLRSTAYSHPQTGLVISFKLAHRTAGIGCRVNDRTIRNPIYSSNTPRNYVPPYGNHFSQ